MTCVPLQHDSNVYAWYGHCCRYIYTRLANLTRHVFNKADDKVLNYLNEEGQSIEPEWWVQAVL